jgi:hypothetical protein
VESSDDEHGSVPPGVPAARHPEGLHLGLGIAVANVVVPEDGHEMRPALEHLAERPEHGVDESRFVARRIHVVAEEQQPVELVLAFVVRHRCARLELVRITRAHIACDGESHERRRAGPGARDPSGCGRWADPAPGRSQSSWWDTSRVASSATVAVRPASPRRPARREAGRVTGEAST